MITIEQATGDLAASQKPILCLDTCDFLDVVRGVAEENLFHARSFRRALKALAVNPDQFQPVITYLVRHEWEQSLVEARVAIEQHLDNMDGRIDRIVEACGLAGVAVIGPIGKVSGLNLPARLIDLAEGLMNQSLVIEKHGDCVERALARVMAKRRPSHKREIKDSIHWEHYLELSRRLAGAGHAQDRVFVSANKADFWADKTISSIHHDLEAEADAAGLRFFGKMDDALRVLRI